MLHERPARVQHTRARYSGNNKRVHPQRVCSNECNEFEYTSWVNDNEFANECSGVKEHSKCVHMKIQTIVSLGPIQVTRLLGLDAINQLAASI
jgi:hypothetical protein